MSGNSQETARAVKEAINSIIARGKTDEASIPFKAKMGDAERYSKLITRPKSKVDAKKKMAFLKTGTFLDGLFFNEKNKPLGGIPIVSQLGITGLSGTGKSILAQEIALKVASENKKVIFVTSEEAFETPTLRNDLQSRMKQKADIMGLDWETVRANLFVMDAVVNPSLNNWSNFIQTLRYLVELLNGIDLLVLDSLTLLESSRFVLKWRVLELSKYCQLNGITTLYICQRSEEKADTYSISGGQGVVHNLDGIICVDFKKAVGQLKGDLNKNRPKDQQIKQWDEIHFVRLMACRLCGFDRTYKECFITKDGFLKLIKQEEVKA